MDKKTADSLFELKRDMSRACGCIREWMDCTPDEIDAKQLTSLTLELIYIIEGATEWCLALGTENTLEAFAVLDASLDPIIHHALRAEVLVDDEAIHEELRKGYRIAYESSHHAILKAAGRIEAERQHWLWSNSTIVQTQQAIEQSDFDFRLRSTYRVWGHLRRATEPQTYDMLTESLQIGRSTCSAALKELRDKGLIEKFTEGGVRPVPDYRKKT